MSAKHADLRSVNGLGIELEPPLNMEELLIIASSLGSQPQIRVPRPKERRVSLRYATTSDALCTLWTVLTNMQ